MQEFIYFFFTTSGFSAEPAGTCVCVRADRVKRGVGGRSCSGGAELAERGEGRGEIYRSRNLHRRLDFIYIDVNCDSADFSTR